MRPAKGGRPCFDFGLSSLKVLCGGRGLELPLERKPDGTLTDGCRERIGGELRRFLGTGERGGIPASCGVAARGVSLRRLDLPPVGQDEVLKILALQVEKEFPISLDRLAWGYLLDGASAGNGDGRASERNGGGRSLRAIVAAVRKEVIEDYGSLLAGCGLRPDFCLGAIAGAALCAPSRGPATVLDIGRTHSEALTLDDGRPVAVRSLPWGTGALEGAAVRPPGEPEEVLPASLPGEAKEDGAPREIPAALAAAVEPLARMVREILPAPADGGRRPLFLIGGGSRRADLARALARALGDDVACKVVKLEPGLGVSAVTVGLDRLAASPDRSPFIGLDSPLGNVRSTARRRPTALRWAVLAAVLGALCLSLRWAGPIVGLRGMEEKVEAARAALKAIPRVDRELEFLLYLEASRSPFLDALAVLAGAAPKGASFASMSLSRQGDIGLQGSLASFAEAGEFRGKLAASRWFTAVVLQEQSPNKDRSRVEFRLTARLAPAVSRPPIPEPAPGSEPPVPEAEAAPVPEPPPAEAPSPAPPEAAPEGKKAAEKAESKAPPESPPAQPGGDGAGPRPPPAAPPPVAEAAPEALAPPIEIHIEGGEIPDGIIIEGVNER